MSERSIDDLLAVLKKRFSELPNCGTALIKVSVNSKGVQSEDMYAFSAESWVPCTVHMKSVQCVYRQETQDAYIRELEAAMQEFVNRCEKGEIRSKYTYAKFKGLLPQPPIGE